MRIGKGSAPGKVIIAGEHSVVYGYPAIAVALGIRCFSEAMISNNEGIVINSIDLGKEVHYTNSNLSQIADGIEIHPGFDSIALATYTTLEEIDQPTKLSISISSQIPISAGLGSSAAVVVSVVAAILDLFQTTLPEEKISAFAFEAEKITHGKPSGIDNSIATYGGLLKFQSGNIQHKRLQHTIPLIIGNTKIPRDTKKLVSGVAELNRSYPILIDSILQTMGDLALEAERYIELRNLKSLGEIVNINQGLLDAIGVGHDSLSQYIWKAREAGALGAKLTGAGGGGCMIAIANNLQDQKSIVNQLESNKFNIISTEISTIGVCIGEMDK